MNLKNIYSYVTGIVRLRGATDNTQIGNNADRLLVESRTLDGAGTQLTLGYKPHATSWPIVFNREKTFHVLATATAIANNKSMLSLYNAGNASVKVRLREVRIINSQTAAVTGIVADFRLKRFTTLHSAGTLLTPESSDSADTLNANVTARTGATIAGEAAGDLRRAQWSSDEWGPGTLDTEGSDHAQQVTGFPLYLPGPEQKPITLNSNEGIHIKQVTNSTAGTFDLLFVFTEETP